MERWYKSPYKKPESAIFYSVIGGFLYDTNASDTAERARFPEEEIGFRERHKWGGVRIGYVTRDPIVVIGCLVLF